MRFQVPNYLPNRKQAAFQASRAPFRLMLGGVGSGKTYIGAWETLLGALANGPGTRYIVGAPSERILRDATWHAYCRALDRFADVNHRRLDVKRLSSPQNRVIRLAGDIEIAFVNLKNPDTFAGPTISGFHLDEGALLTDGMAAWEVLLERSRGPGRRFGIVTTTPRGPVGVVQHFVEQCDWIGVEKRCGSARNADYDMVASTTWDNVEHLGLSYIQRMLTGKSKRQIRQQLHADVLDFKGAVYSDAFSSGASMAHGWTAAAMRAKGIEVHLAIDWGPNYPHVLWIAYDPDLDVDVVFDEFCDDGLHPRELLEAAEQQGIANWGLHRWDYAGVHADRNPQSAVNVAYAFFGRSDSESVRRRRTSQWVPVATRRVRGTDDLREGIDVVSARLRDHDDTRRLFFAPHLERTPSTRRIVQCMRLYAWREFTAGSAAVLDDVRPVKGLYDHGPDALRYYAWPRYWARAIRSARGEVYERAKEAA